MPVRLPAAVPPKRASGSSAPSSARSSSSTRLLGAAASSRPRLGADDTSFVPPLEHIDGSGDRATMTDLVQELEYLGLHTSSHNTAALIVPEGTSIIDDKEFGMYPSRDVSQEYPDGQIGGGGQIGGTNRTSTGEAYEAPARVLKTVTQLQEQLGLTRPPSHPLERNLLSNKDVTTRPSSGSERFVLVPNPAEWRLWRRDASSDWHCERLFVSDKIPMVDEVYAPAGTTEADHYRRGGVSQRRARGIFQPKFDKFEIEEADADLLLTALLDTSPGDDKLLGSSSQGGDVDQRVENYGTKISAVLYTASKPYCWTPGYGQRNNKESGTTRTSSQEDVVDNQPASSWDAWSRNWKSEIPWQPAGSGGVLCKIENFDENRINIEDADAVDPAMVSPCAQAVEYVNKLGRELSLPSGASRTASARSAFFEKEVKFSLLPWFDEKNYGPGAEWKCEMICDMISRCVMYSMQVGDVDEAGGVPAGGFQNVQSGTQKHRRLPPPVCSTASMGPKGSKPMIRLQQEWTSASTQAQRGRRLIRPPLQKQPRFAFADCVRC
ncbi:unnamed protein product [Amoebophrya sp. A120]|nr:unnamed protein product [Amoebophrya sp. A120]|eukprot:GSA120T00021247001.1